MAGVINRFLNTNAKGGSGANPVSDMLRQCRRAFWLVALLTFAVQVMSITPILFMMNTFDRVMTSRSDVTLVSLVTLVLVAYGFWSALEWVRARLMIRLSLRIDWDTAVKVFDAAFRRQVAHKPVDVHQAMNDVVALRQFMTGAPLLALMSAPYAIIFVIVGWAFHPYLALFIAAATALQLFAAYTTSRVTTPALREADRMSAQASRVAESTLRLSESALPLGMHHALRRRWFAVHREFLSLQVNASESAGVIGGLNSFITHALPSVQMALAVWLAVGGFISGGMVMVASYLISFAVQPIVKVVTSWPQIQSAKLALERLNALLAEDEAQRERMSLPRPVGKLDVAGLLAQPPGARRPILQNLTFAAEPGQAIAVMGPSASGKTSLLKHLVGLWEPLRGHVRLDGADIAPWIRDDLGRHIGYVPQDIELFEGTVAENIARMGEVDAEKVVEAAKATGIHELVLSFPKGYDTVIGRDGHALTGGQKQRLAIARAVYGDPSYVVMDEPNSNLDDDSERWLVQLVHALRQRRVTVVFSTHRPKLVAIATHVLVLKEGQQVTFGPVQAVLNQLKHAGVSAAPSNANGAAAANTAQPAPASPPASGAPVSSAAGATPASAPLVH